MKIKGQQRCIFLLCHPPCHTYHCSCFWTGGSAFSTPTYCQGQLACARIVRASANLLCFSTVEILAQTWAAWLQGSPVLSIETGLMGEGASKKNLYYWHIDRRAGRDV